MFDPITLALIGSAVGGLTNKKDPLKGALMGGALGLGGGALAAGASGGLLGAAPAAGSQAGMLAAQEAGLGMGSLGWKGATTGVQGMMNAGAASGLLDTAGNAAKTAATVKSLMPAQQPVPTAPAYSTGGGTQMGSVYQQIQQNRLALQQANDEMRRRRQQQISLLG